MNSLNDHRVIVTYASAPGFLATDHWKQAYAALLCQFPLHSLHWKSTARNAIQNIQELDVKLVPLDSLRDTHTSQIPRTLLEKPLLNLFLAVCEDNETYKGSVRKQIRDWHASVTQRRNQEWLIIHLIRPEEKTAQGRIFQVKTSVLDNIKANFNVEKKDRCVQLVWSMEYDNPAAWAELINKMKEGILSAFDSSFTQREEEVKRSEGQRQMPGWNFCTFFILKESLAISLEGMSLYEEALQQYNELESSFFRVLREKNLSWFGAFISPGPTDDSASLLSVTKKTYRDLILANSISIFDFRVYLLARQCALLSKMGRVVEICRKTITFLTGFGRRLRELEDTLPMFFVESWTYSSALSVVETCDAWAGNASFSKISSARFSALKGELLELAQQQLDIIGTKVGHLPMRPPFSIVIPPPSPTMDKPSQERSTQKITRSDLITAIDNQESFYDLYIQLANRAIELYASAGRRKFALKLHGNLAALDVVRKRLPNAFETYKSLPAHYAPHGWTSLETFMRLQALSVHASTAKAKDEDWAHIVLDFFKAYVDDFGKELTMDLEDETTYISGLVSDLCNSVRELQPDLLYPDYPAFSVRVVDKVARLSNSEDGALLDVNVHNHLPCDFPVEEVVVTLVGAEGVQLTFSANTLPLVSGTTRLTLFCPSATAGAFAVQLSQLKLSGLVFEWVDANVSACLKGSKFKEAPKIVRIPKDLHAVDVRLRPPQCIELGAPAKLTVALHTGRNTISTATLRLSTPSGIQFRFAEAVLEPQGQVTLQTSKEAIKLSELDSDKIVKIELPHSDASSYHILRVNINLEYVATMQPALTRKLKFVRFVATSLPMTVNVEDFFRGSRLFTRFTLSTASHQHIRIQSAKLRPSEQDGDPVKITGCQSQKPAIVTITPAQSGRFVFQLDAARGQGKLG
ncbi:uncharacterized protein FIBRA_01362 [Fibroporia radiculosa]|uniref:Trafficking protein particle complex subunit 10 n=1 Tax=Fibroporia radiculosa TaxID=599839 RepID=J4H123_9APHY|nr:uncharacterized protein FIBRA_01362 [Fibroporia radiculosa]CCL99344.1 predicted protein [Fibroporia radiculosa]